MFELSSRSLGKLEGVNNNLVLTFMDQIIMVRFQMEYFTKVVLIEEIFTTQLIVTVQHDPFYKLLIVTLVTLILLVLDSTLLHKLDHFLYL